MQHKSLKVWDILEPLIEKMAYEFVGVEHLKQGKQAVLRVYIDSPDGINLDDCTKVSHQVSGVLDVEDPIGSAYDLEVSSPGLHRPLFKLSDFERFVGCKASVRLMVPLDRRRNFKGMLGGVRDEKVLIEVDGQEFEIDFRHIERAKLVPEFK